MNEIPLSTGASKETPARPARRPLSPPARVTMFALIGAALGIVTGVIEGLVKVGHLFLPPAIILVVTLLIAGSFATRWRWMPALAALYAIFFLLGGALLGSAAILDRMTHPADILGFLEIWIQMTGMVIAAIAGLLATMQEIMRRKS